MFIFVTHLIKPISDLVTAQQYRTLSVKRHNNAIHHLVWPIPNNFFLDRFSKSLHIYPSFFKFCCIFIVYLWRISFFFFFTNRKLLLECIFHFNFVEKKKKNSMKNDWFVEFDCLQFQLAEQTENENNNNKHNDAIQSIDL